MTTFGQLTEDVLLYLHGFTQQQDQASYLTASVTASDTTLPVADATAMSRGLVEVGDELVWIDDVNTSGLVIQAPPYGRGYAGTTAEAHTSGARVTVSPAFPRSVVKRAINEAVGSVYPTLWGVDRTTFTYVSGQATYEMPAGTKSIVSVVWQDYDIQTEWHTVKRFSLDQNANTSVFPSGSALTIREPVLIGRTVHVVYTKQPTVLSADGDVFTTVTGLPESCTDLIRLGAIYRLLSTVDAMHLVANSAEADFSAQQRQGAAMVQQARWVLQQYQMRLSEEANRLNQLYPTTVRYTF